MLLAGLAAVAAPTGISVLTHHGDGLCPYSPFVMIAAVALNWRAATLVALVSGLVGGFLSVSGGPSSGMGGGTTDVLFFGLASALMIGFAEAFRKAAADPLWLNGPPKSSKGVVFSLKDGQACVSWYGGKAFVPLGPADEVERMMQDFLAQQQVARRLRG